MLLLIKILGWCLAKMPERLLACLCTGMGWLIYHLPIRRTREMKSNLHHAFPEKDDAWRARVGKLTSARLVEMALFSLASPFFKRRWFETHMLLDEEVLARVEGIEGRGGVGLMPHLTLFEMMCSFPAIHPESAGNAAVYRPLKQKAVDQWAKGARERWGLRLLSRKDGMRQITKTLRDGKTFTLLFDQNTGKQGSLILFFDRMASATHLPGLLAKKFDVPACWLFPRRVGFWKVKVDFGEFSAFDDPGELIFKSHEKLESYLKESESQAADWLWFHNRWGTHDKPRNRFFIRESDNLLERSMGFHQVSAMPRKTRLWFRLPNWLGDVVMALPLIRAVRDGRPDAEITVLAQPALRPLLEYVELADRIIDLPSKKNTLSYFRHFRKLEKEYPDAYLCFTNSSRGDLEAFLTAAPRRLGMLRPGKRRPFLTDVWRLPETANETKRHQLDVWEDMFRYLGLRVPLSRAPLREHVGRNGVGLICGTENMPEKRWPVEHWRGLVERLLASSSEMVNLYGTARDREITNRVAEGFDPERVKNRAGETNLKDYLQALSDNRAVICNDTGGMHLANMLGVPIYAIFGPTNPVRTGPAYEAPTHILQPPGCPASGGKPISEVTVEELWKVWEKEAE